MEIMYLVIHWLVVALSKQCFHELHVYTGMLRANDGIVFEMVFVNVS